MLVRRLLHGQYTTSTGKFEGLFARGEPDIDQQIQELLHVTLNVISGVCRNAAESFRRIITGFLPVTDRMVSQTLEEMEKRMSERMSVFLFSSE